MTTNEIWILAIFYAALNLGGFALYFINFVRLIVSFLQLNSNALGKAQKRINQLIPNILYLILNVVMNIPSVFWGYFFLSSGSKTFSGIISLFLIIYLISILSLCILAILTEISFYIFFKPILDMKERALEALVYSPTRNFLVNLPIRYFSSLHRQ